MLKEFLEQHRTEILTLTEEKTQTLAGPLSSSKLLRQGLPMFYEHLIEYLQSRGSAGSRKDIVVSAATHGRELLRLGYTLSHVVHAYGAMCQAITGLAQRQNADISAREFNELNMCLDIAIAAAVSEFQFQTVQASEEKEVQHLGLLVHELRNALSSATIAHEMIKQGLVGTSGSTSRILEDNLARMRLLIDRSLSEVRMRADPEIHAETFSLNILVDQITLSARRDAIAKHLTIQIEIPTEIELRTDRQLLLSAIANLLQNGLKYSKHDGIVYIRATSSAENIVIEIEDACGGLNKDVEKNLFKPFASGGFDQSGLGLGLTIVQRALVLLGGKVTVQNHPGESCTFILELPRVFTAAPTTKAASGISSAQPGSSNPTDVKRPR